MLGDYGAYETVPTHAVIVRSFREVVADAFGAWLDVSSRSGAAEAAILSMANGPAVRPWESKGAVNRAGEALRAGALTGPLAVIVEEWRIAHKPVINTFQASLRGRARGFEIEVAQRLKRRATIADKLFRYSRMELARMDDVAGCRVIFQNMDALYEFRSRFNRSRFNHVLRNDVDKYDYIKSPTDRGYRGIHDVYEYKARQKKPTASNGLLIEIQYRTQVQHAWATAVEVVTQLTENEPKFDRGDRRHIRFFCLASEIIARTSEERKSCLPKLSGRELVEEFEAIDGEIYVMNMLLNLKAFEWIGEQAKSKHVILHTKKAGDLQLHQFDLELEASRALFDLEKANPDDDVVLVGAESVSEVVSAFRNYFRDVGGFLKLIRKGREELTGQSNG